MSELNSYYIQGLENLIDLFTSVFVIIDDICNEIIPMSIIKSYTRIIKLNFTWSYNELLSKFDIFNSQIINIINTKN